MHIKFKILISVDFIKKYTNISLGTLILLKEGLN